MPPAGSDTSAASTRSTKFIEQHLVKLARDMTLACNSRHWDQAAYPWTCMSPDFTTGPTFATLPANMDLPGFFEGFSTLYGDIPEYYARIMSITAQMSEKAGEAQVYANFQNVNFTPGVTRYSVGLWEFRETEEGGWRCVLYRSLPGPTG